VALGDDRRDQRLAGHRAVVPLLRKVDVRLPGKGNGARPVHLIITMIKWIRTSRLSIKNSLSLSATVGNRGGHRVQRLVYRGTSLIRNRHPP